MATGDFGPGRMPPDMFYNCNEEIKRKKDRTIGSQNMLISTIRGRIRIRRQASMLGRGFAPTDGKGLAPRD